MDHHPKPASAPGKAQDPHTDTPSASSAPMHTNDTHAVFMDSGGVLQMFKSTWFRTYTPQEPHHVRQQLAGIGRTLLHRKGWY